MAGNWNWWFLEFYFYLKYISNKDYIWQGGTLPRVLLEERKLNISKQKNIMAAQKCKIIQWVIRKKLNLEGLQTYQRYENNLIMS